MIYYNVPEDLTGTVFDPSDETFGPIMADIQAGRFEEARDRLAILAETTPRGDPWK